MKYRSIANNNDTIKIRNVALSFSSMRYKIETYLGASKVRQEMAWSVIVALVADRENTRTHRLAKNNQVLETTRSRLPGRFKFKYICLY